MATTFTQIVDGELILASDLMGDNDATRNVVGIALTEILGAVAALPTPGAGYTPLAMTPVASAASFNIGGLSQLIFLQGRVIDNCPSQVLAIPSNNATGVTRIDIVAVQYQQLQSNGISREILLADGVTKTTSTVFQLLETVAYQYVTGTATAPAVPAGYVTFATVSVPNGFTTAAGCMVTLAIPTVQSLLANIVGALVTSINGAIGAVTMIAGTGVQVALTGPAQVTLTNSGVTSINSVGGAFNINSGAGITVSIAGTTLSVANAGVTSLAGQTGAVSLQSGTGITLSQPNASTTAITNTGVTALNSQTGGVTIQAGANVTVSTPSAGVVSISAVGAAGAAGGTGPAGAAGGIGPTGATGPQGPNGGIGSTAFARTRITGVSASVSATIPYVLGTGNWTLWAEAKAELATGSMTLTGASGTWAAPSTCPDLAGIEVVELSGTAIGGQQPSVTLSFSGATQPGASYLGHVILWAVRNS